MDRIRVLATCCLGFSVFVHIGCGQTSDQPAAETVAASSEAGSEAAKPAAPESPAAQAGEPAGVTASIEGATGTTSDGKSSDGPANETADATSPPEHESVAILKQIQQLRVAPVTGDIEAARIARMQRNQQIVDLATSVLRLTMNDADHEAQFHQAIGQLLEARFQMALAGSQEDIESLYADVQALNDRDPESVAAAEGVYYLARFAHTKAGLAGKSNPVWFETFSRWAREFSDRFPQQSQRAVALLFGAARSCELHALATDDPGLRDRLTTEAKLCYSSLAENFPQSTQGQEAVAVLRRMAVVGQRLSQFSGPTVDGGFLSAEDFSGKPTLIYFWESSNEEFASSLLPLLIKLQKSLPPERLRIVGVPLDDEELEFDAFVESHEVPGQQIFFPDAQQRSWDSPLLKYWGVSRIPSVWVIDQSGVVVTTDADSRSLVAVLQKVFGQ